MHTNLAVPISLVLLLTSPAAFSAEWIFLGLDQRGNAWHIDQSSVVREHDLATVWKRIEVKEPHPRFQDGSPIGRVFLLDVAYCTERRVGVKAIKLVAPDGAVIAAREHDPISIEWPMATPATLIENLLALVCPSAGSPRSGAPAWQ